MIVVGVFVDTPNLISFFSFVYVWFVWKPNILLTDGLDTVQNVNFVALNSIIPDKIIAV